MPGQSDIGWDFWLWRWCWNKRKEGVSSHSRSLCKVNMCHYTQLRSPRIEREDTLRDSSRFVNPSSTSSFPWRKHGVNARDGRLYKGPKSPSLGSSSSAQGSSASNYQAHGSLSTLLYRQDPKHNLRERDTYCANRVQNIFLFIHIHHIYIKSSSVSVSGLLQIYVLMLLGDGN